MKPTTKTSIVFAGAVALLAGTLLLTGPRAESKASPAKGESPPVLVHKADRVIQLALLLDTSSSMDGLIDQARSQMWKVVNELARAERAGVRPKLEIAIYEYGNDHLPAVQGFLRQVMPFSSDLDAVSEQLFALTTDGGSEYAGQVIQSATHDLAWSRDDADLKLIFIAGNEEFTQGAISVEESLRAAAERGIFVNTIYCGAGESAEAIAWRDGAALASGQFVAINQNHEVLHIASPYDVEIARLGSELNSTYVAYGSAGTEGAMRQAAQDNNAAARADSVVSRSVAKANAVVYDNSGWDLVDAVTNQQVELGALTGKDLPPALRGMTAEQRLQYVTEQRERRGALQAQIRELNDKRTAYTAAQRVDSSDPTATLDSAMITTVRDQGKAVGYRFQ